MWRSSYLGWIMTFLLVATRVTFAGDIPVCNCNDGLSPCDPGETCKVGCFSKSGFLGQPLCGYCVIECDEEGFESGASGWSNDPASTCSAGSFIVGNPTQVIDGGVVTQPSGSYSGTGSIFTATNTSAGTHDVDGGNCILTSPTWSVTNEAVLSVWYFHGQRDTGDDSSGDFFRLEYTTDSGSSWTALASHGDSASNAVWTNATTTVPAGSSVQLRVQCSDGSTAGDLVECGIDEVSLCELP